MNVAYLDNFSIGNRKIKSKKKKKKEYLHGEPSFIASSISLLLIMPGH